MRLVALILAGFFMPVVSSAAVFAVDTTADSVDTAPGDGTCADIGGSCSLRAAVIEANQLPGADRVELPAGTFNLTIGGIDDFGNFGDLDTLGPIEIVGAGAGSTVIAAFGVDGAIDVIGASASLSDVTVQGARVRNAFGATLALVRSEVTQVFHIGAQLGLPAVENHGSLTLSFVRVANNSADGVRSDGQLTITDSEISNNHPPGPPPFPDDIGSGVVIDHPGVALIERSVVSGNSSFGDEAVGAGLVHRSAGSLTVRHSRFFGNQPTGVLLRSLFTGTGAGPVSITDSTIADNDRGVEIRAGNLPDLPVRVERTSVVGSDAFAQAGAGVRITGGRRLVLVNATISGNRAGTDGGGFFLDSTSGQAPVVELYSSTVTENVADADNNGSGNGGGVAVVAGNFSYTSTVIGNNVDAGSSGSASAPDCAGAIFSGGFSSLHRATGCTLSAGAGDVNGAHPLLAALALDGGTTPTHVPVAGSPLLDRGPAAGCQDDEQSTLLVDQRGYPRSVDGDAVPGARCDIGAAERDPSLVFADGFESGTTLAWSAIAP